MEGVHSLNDLVNLVHGRKNSGADVVSTLFLTETRTRDADDTSLLKEIEAVHEIGSLTLLLGLFNGLRRHSESEVGVESTINREAGDAIEAVQSGGELLGTDLEGVEDTVLLLLEELVGGITGLGRVDHDVHGVLTIDVGAAADGEELVEFSTDVLGEVDHFEVTTAATAFTPVTLGGGVEGDQLAVELQVAHDLLEGDELITRAVDVFLVDFISKNSNVLAGADLADVLNVGTGEALTGGVTGVDGSDGLHGETLGASALDGLLNISDIESPIVLLAQVVRLILTTEDVNGGGVERILRNGDEDTVGGLVNEELESILNSLRGTVGQENVLGVARITVTLLNVLGDIFADLGDTVGVGVSTRTTRVSNEEFLSSLEGIRVEHLRVLLSNLGPGGDAEDFSQEGDGLLLNGLRVTDVAVKEVVEGELLALLHLVVDFNSAEDDFTSDGIISSSDVLVDVVDGDTRREGSHSGESNVLSKAEHFDYGRRLFRNNYEKWNYFHFSTFWEFLHDSVIIGPSCNSACYRVIQLDTCEFHQFTTNE